MKIKTLAVVIACLAVLSGAVYWLDRPAPPPPADARAGQALLDPGVADRAAQLRFSDQGKTIALTRQADGSWRVDSYFGLPADFDKLSHFIGDLTAARIQRLVTANPERLARLEFTDSKIELLDASGAPLWSVVLGKAAEGGGRFVRFGGEPKAYLTNLSAFLDTEPKGWADATLVSLKPDDVARIEIPLPGSPPVTVTRAKKDDAWSSAQAPAGQRISADKVASLLSALTALRFSDTSEPSDPQAAAARAHERAFQLTLFDGRTYSIALGRKPEEKKLKPPAAAAGPLPKASDQGATAAGPPAPEYDVIPAGPVYAFVSSSDPKAPASAFSARRAFQIEDYVFSGLPQIPSDLFEPVTAPAPKPASR